MADVTNLTGVISTIGIFVNNGTAATPRWDYVCAIDSRSFNETRAERTTNIVATCGPGASVETWRAAGARDWSIEGEAALEIEAFTFCRAWMELGNQKTVRIIFYRGDKNALVAFGYYQGAGVLLSYNITQPNANDIPNGTINISKGSGTLVWATGAPT